MINPAEQTVDPLVFKSSRNKKNHAELTAPDGTPVIELIRRHHKKAQLSRQLALDPRRSAGAKPETAAIAVGDPEDCFVFI